MLRSLSTKIVAVLLGVFVLTGILFTLVARFYVDRYMLEVAQRLYSPMAKYVVADVLPLKSRPFDNQTLVSVFDSLMFINPAIELYLLDEQGKILAFSAPPNKVKTESVDLEPINAYLNGAGEYPMFGDDPRSDKKKFFPVAQFREDDFSGFLYVVLGGESFDFLSTSLAGGYIVQVSIWALILSVSFRDRGRAAHLLHTHAPRNAVGGGY